MKIKYGLPESKNDITVRDHIKYLKWLDENYSITDESTDDEKEDFIYRQNLKRIEIFYKIDPSHVQHISVADYEEMITYLDAVYSIENRIIQTFSYKGVEYGLIPNFLNIKMSEMVDLDTFNDVRDYDKLLQIIYRPIKKKIGDKYNIEKYNPSKIKDDFFGDASYEILEGGLAFFLRSYATLTAHTLLYSVTEINQHLLN